MAANLLTPAEAAKRLGCSKRTLHDYVKAGELRYVRIGMGKLRPRKRFADADIEEFIAQRTEREVPPSLHTRGKRRAAPNETSAFVERLRTLAATRPSR